MATHAAFLRGINLGGRRPRSPELISILSQAGFEQVGTFRASGNVVFTAKRGDPLELGKQVQDALREGLGYEVPTFIRTAAEVTSIAAQRPFPAEQLEAGGKLQVILLNAPAGAAARREILALATDDDRLALEAGEIYWLPSGGLLDSDLDLDAIARITGPSTTRTMGTVEQLTAKFFAG